MVARVPTIQASHDKCVEGESMSDADRSDKGRAEPRQKMATKRLIVCADDYALTPGVSQSIRALITANRISATSVIAGSPHWPDEAAALRRVPGGANIGLHITLTDQTPLGPMPTFAPAGRFPPMPVVHKAGLLRRLPLDEIESELERQLTQFMAHYGQPPAHIDGHHHVHQLPGVRDLVVAMAARFAGRTWVRSCRERPTLVVRRAVAPAKALVIGALGAGIEWRALRQAVPVNSGFSGVYAFDTDARAFGILCKAFLQGGRENALMMCHPGHSDATLAALDPMTGARDREHAYFMSDDWPALVAAANLEIGPFRLP
jgi:chitin disaccharide deacetylase